MKREKQTKKELYSMTNQDNYLSTFRKNIDVCAENRNMTLREISEKADIPFATLNSFLYGNQKDCKLSTAMKLAKALEIPLDELVGCGLMFKEEKMLVAKLQMLPKKNQYLIKWIVDFKYERIYGNPMNKSRKYRWLHIGDDELDDVIGYITDICCEGLKMRS